MLDPKEILKDVTNEQLIRNANAISLVKEERGEDFDILECVFIKELIDRYKKLEQRDEVWREKKSLLENSLAKAYIEISNLKCCGNCKHYEDENNCPLDQQTREAWELCDKWMYDGWEQEGRKNQEEYTGN